MKFEECYTQMQGHIRPEDAVLRRTITQTTSPPRKRTLRRTVAVAVAAALCISISATVLVSASETAYQVLYSLSPAAAQFFQPVRRSCEDNGIRMEVVGVSVEGDTAQAYITLQDLEGDRVDATTDLYDSYSLYIPFDSISHCERLGFDEETKTATFLVTAQTANGEPIPNRKQSFSLRCFLSGKETVKDLAVDLPLGAYLTSAPTTEQYANSGGGGSGSRFDAYWEAPRLLPGEPIVTPVEGLSMTAAGYAMVNPEEGSVFGVQVQCYDNLQNDNHCQLYLKDRSGNVVDTVAHIAFQDGASEGLLGYDEFYFDVPPEELADYTLYGDFYTSQFYTEGNWRVTFPLEDTQP